MKKVLITALKTIGYVLTSFILLSIGQVLGMVLAKPMTNSSNEGLAFAGMYFAFIGIWIAIVAYCFIVKKNRKYLPKLTKGGKGNNIKTALLIGLPCGIGINLLVGIVALLHGDIALSFNTFNPAMLLLFIVCVAVQSGAEELTERFFLYQKIKELYPNCPAVPIIVNAIVFGAIHLCNPGIQVLGISNIVLVGVMYSLIIYYFDSFWAAVVAHATWNFCQNIILGLPNSGIVSSYSIFKLDTSIARNSFAYNTSFGIESTVLSTILLAAACVIFIVIGKRRQLKNLLKMDYKLI